jgi:hypothetical protein
VREFKVFKYVLTQGALQTVDMPRGAELLCVQQQNSQSCLWALADGKRKTTKRMFILVETGQLLPYRDSDVDYIGTLLQDGGNYVLHAFEVTIVNDDNYDEEGDDEDE